MTAFVVSGWEGFSFSPFVTIVVPRRHVFKCHWVGINILLHFSLHGGHEPGANKYQGYHELYLQR